MGWGFTKWVNSVFDITMKDLILLSSCLVMVTASGFLLARCDCSRTTGLPQMTTPSTTPAADVPRSITWVTTVGLDLPLSHIERVNTLLQSWCSLSEEIGGIAMSLSTGGEQINHNVPSFRREGTKPRTYWGRCHAENCQYPGNYNTNSYHLSGPDNVPGTGLRQLLMTNWYYYPDFTDEKTESQTWNTVELDEGFFLHIRIALKNNMNTKKVSAIPSDKCIPAGGSRLSYWRVLNGRF